AAANYESALEHRLSICAPAVFKPLSQKAENISARLTEQTPIFLIVGKRECENHAAVNQRDSMQRAPAKRAPRGPIDYITQHVRDGDPKETCKNQQISKYS